MKVFALGDLHLSGNSDKPMDVFGSRWEDHLNRIKRAWALEVCQSDLVLIPGDISWAMQIEDAKPDIFEIGALPGTKLLLRGNHDYWWSSVSKVRSILPDKMYALQNDSFEFENIAVAGSRGWTCPGSGSYSEGDDKKIYERELMRLEMSLKSASVRGKPIIAMLHYPPFNERRQPSGFTELLERYNVMCVVYGHLHDKSCKNAFEGERNGIRYHLCSADHLSFSPKLILDMNE